MHWQQECSDSCWDCALQCRQSHQHSLAALSMTGCIGFAAGLGQAPQAAVGVLGLHPDTVQRALTDHTLGLLLPPTLSVTFQPCDPPADPPHSLPQSENQLGSSSQGSVLDHQQGANAPHSHASPAQLSQQSSQHSSHGLEESLTPSHGRLGWRRLSGGPEGAGFGGNRGFLWAMVAAVGAPIPMTMQVRQTAFLPGHNLVDGCS